MIIRIVANCLTFIIVAASFSPMFGQTTRTAGKPRPSGSKKTIKATPSAAEIARREQEQARLAAEQEKQDITAQANQISQLILNNVSAQAIRELDSFTSKYASNELANSLASNLYLKLGDYVAAEHHINKAIAVSQNQTARIEYQNQSASIAAKRQALVIAWLDEASRLLNEMNYSDVLTMLPKVDKIVLYDPKVAYIRGTLSGMYRKYENAVKIFNRMLEDTSLDSATKAKVTSLRDYCLEKAVANLSFKSTGDQVCRTCKAHISKRTAYCPVCLSYQPKITTLKLKHTTTSFEYSEAGSLTSVRYRYYNDHTGSNMFGAIMGGMAAAGGNSVPVSIQDSDDINRGFEFEYENGALRKVNFESEAVVGGNTVMVAQTIGGVATTTKTDREEADMASFSQNETLVYANNPNLDAEFTLRALGENLYRGFAANNTFTPFWWLEPHIMIFYYDKDQRVVKAVDAYNYSNDTNPAGHRVVTGRKPFVGPNHSDPLTSSEIYTINYNAEGLISSIVLTNRGKETYRREMFYGQQGIVEEREYWGGSTKKPFVTKYKWTGNQLVEAKRGDVKASFVP